MSRKLQAGMLAFSITAAAMGLASTTAMLSAAKVAPINRTADRPATAQRSPLALPYFSYAQGVRADLGS